MRAEDLVPQLPNPKDLQPFPTVCSMVYKGHEAMVRSISLEPQGQYFASGSDDGLLKGTQTNSIIAIVFYSFYCDCLIVYSFVWGITLLVWEIRTGRCVRSWQFTGIIRSVAWNPNKSLCLVAVAIDNDVILVNPRVGDKLFVDKTDELLSQVDPAAPGTGTGYEPSERLMTAVQWEPVSADNWEKGHRLHIKHFRTVKQVCLSTIFSVFSGEWIRSDIYGMCYVFPDCWLGGMAWERRLFCNSYARRPESICTHPPTVNTQIPIPVLKVQRTCSVCNFSSCSTYVFHRRKLSFLFIPLFMLVYCKPFVSGSGHSIIIIFLLSIVLLLCYC